MHMWLLFQYKKCKKKPVGILRINHPLCTYAYTAQNGIRSEKTRIFLCNKFSLFYIRWILFSDFFFEKKEKRKLKLWEANQHHQSYYECILLTPFDMSRTLPSSYSVTRSRTYAYTQCWALIITHVPIIFLFDEFLCASHTNF